MENFEEFFNNFDQDISLTLTYAGLFLLLHQILRTQIVENVTAFFERHSKDYNECVLSKINKAAKIGIYEASYLWLKEIAAIEESDIKTIEMLKTRRDIFSHKIRNIFTNSKAVFYKDAFEAKCLIDKLGQFWGKLTMEIEHPEINPNEVTPVYNYTLLTDRLFKSISS